MRRIPFNESYFEQDTEGSFYWAGFLAADGCVRHYNKKVGKSKDGSFKYSESYIIDVSQNDKEHLELFLSHINSGTRKLRERNYFNNKANEIKTSYSFELRSKKMYLDLQRFGIVERKSYYLQMPEWLANHELVHHYIRGYFDGDGAIFFTRGTPVIDIVGTFDFISSIKKVFANDIAFKANVKRLKDKKYTARIVFSGPFITAKIATWMYKDHTIALPRKRNIAAGIINSPANLARSLL